MSDRWVGPGWWMASDGKWYPPRGERPADTDEQDTRQPIPTTIDEPTAQGWRSPSKTDTVSIEPLESMRDLLPAAREAVARERREEPKPFRVGRVEETEDLAATEDLSEAEIEATEDLVEATQPSAEVNEPGAAVIDLTADETVAEDTQIDLTAAAEEDAVDEAAEVPQPVSALLGAKAASSPTPEAPVARADVSAPRSDEPTQAVPVAGLKFVEPALEAEEEVDTAQDTSSGASAEPSSTHPVPLQHAVLDSMAPEPPRRSRRGAVLLLLAALLAIASGVLGTLWLQERSDAEDLRTELAAVTSDQDVADRGIEELSGEIDRLRLDNERLEQQLADASALVLELPAGRVTEIAVPFTPVLADEENNRLIALGEDGSYVIWAEGAEGPVTDTGSVTGSPTGLFASLRKAWISTDAQRIEVLSLVAGEPGLPAVEFGPTGLLAPEERGYWTFNENLGEIVRLRKSDGGITAGVSVPTEVVDLTIGAGSVWALGADGLVYRINTADFTVQPIDAGPDLISITAGPDSLWTLSAADGSLRRIDPVTAEILVTVPVGRDPIDASFAGSSVWVALRSGASLIEVDTRTSAVISRTTMPSEPTALHQGDTGVFVAMEGDVRLVRVSSLLTEIEPEATEAEETEAADG